jgi:arylsulfatase A-like enzyme
MILRPRNYTGNWSHSAPWGFLQRVPLLLYGPGMIPAGRVVRRPVTSADLAPTQASLMGFDFAAPDGVVLREAVVEGAAPPRLILTVIWDGGGRNVLAEHADAWPFLERLIARGTWFERATVGSSPSATPPVHTTLATGAFPRRHGLTDITVRRGGRVEDVDDAEGAPLVPTLGDLFDEARNNRAGVALVGSHYTVGMLGMEARRPGADRDVLAMHSLEKDWALRPQDRGWTLPAGGEDLFEFPGYVRDVDGLDRALRALDLKDGQIDGTWAGNPILDVPSSWLTTPAFSMYQTDVVEEVIRREGLGADEVPDLLYVNYKQIDRAAHAWSMHAPEVEAVVRSSDAALEALVEAVDLLVGRGNWVLAFTADHGLTPDARKSGGALVDVAELEADIEQAFDRDGTPGLVQEVRVTQIFVDEGELSEDGATLDDLARFLMEYTRADNAVDPGRVPEAERDRRLYAAAFDARALQDPPCLEGR